MRFLKCFALCSSIGLLAVASVAQSNLLPLPGDEPVWTYLNAAWEQPTMAYSRVQFTYGDELITIGGQSYRMLQLARANQQGNVLLSDHVLIREDTETQIIWGILEPSDPMVVEVKLMDLSIALGATTVLHSLVDDGSGDTAYEVVLSAIEQLTDEMGELRDMYVFESPEPGLGSTIFIRGIGFANRPFSPVSGTMHDVYHLQCLVAGQDDLIYFESDPGLFGLPAESAVCGTLGPVLSNRDNASAYSFDIYPNPATKAFKVALPGPNEITETLYIYDLSGRMVMHEQRVSSGLGLHVGHLKPGMYVVRAQNANQTYEAKLVINGQ